MLCLHVCIAFWLQGLLPRRPSRRIIKLHLVVTLGHRCGQVTDNNSHLDSDCFRLALPFGDSSDSPREMLHVTSLSGEKYAVPAQDNGDARALKAYFSRTHGFPPRFQQRLFLDGNELEDSTGLEAAVELNLLLLPLSCTQPDELVAAIAEGSAAQVETLLKIPQDPNQADADSRLPLQMASVAGNVDIVRLLLEARANTNSADSVGCTALMGACNSDHADVGHLLLEAGADVDLVDIDGYTALMRASDKGHASVVKLLLQAGASTGIVSENGCSALMFASTRGRQEATRLLLEAGADPNFITEKGLRGYTPLMNASSSGHTEVVQLLLAGRADPNVASNVGQTALMGAASQGRVEVVRLLLEARSDANFSAESGSTALDDAGDHREVLALLEPHVEWRPGNNRKHSATGSSCQVF